MKKYSCLENAVNAFNNGHLSQKELEAQIIAFKNDEKSKNCVKAGANLPSQWGKVVNNEQRLIDNGHYMKTSERAKLDFMRESYKKAKKTLKEETTIVRVSKK